MAVFTFIVRKSGGSWTAKQHGGEADLEASSASTWELQRKLTNLALTSAGSGAVSSTFSLITPTSAVAQVMEIFLQMIGILLGFRLLDVLLGIRRYRIKSQQLVSPTLFGVDSPILSLE